MVQLMTRLKESPATYEQLSAFSGVSKRALSRFIALLREPNVSPNNVYISSYAPDRNGRPFVPLWAWGPGQQDAPRPGDTKTDAQRMKEARAAKKNLGVEK